jgi:signal transduction histidine kinase
MVRQDFKQILIVDDSAPDRFAIKRSLKKYAGSDLNFTEADSAAAAVKILKEKLFDALIVDFYLRDTPGTDLISRLRDEEGGLPCPVVMVTGSMESEKLAVQALEAGAHDYIEKSRLAEPALWKAILYARSRYQLAREFSTTTKRLTLLNEELERKNRLKTEFLANATHELRTPVSAIIGLVGLIRDNEGLPADLEDHLASITACCDSLLHSVNDVLDLTKIETGEFVLERSPFCPFKIVQRVTQTFNYLAISRDIEIRSCVPDFAPHLLGDGKRVMQILMNFVGNALKYTDGGTITIRLFLDSEGDKVKARFEVEDTGVGIPSYEVPHIFDRHYQASNSSQKVASSGLGLAIVKELADQMGGEIGCRSVVGEGTLFWFEIQFPEVSKVSDEKSEPNTLEPTAYNVLIAEDNTILGKVVQHQFQKLGCRVTVVPSGEEAVEVASAQEFDLIVLDARMPGIGGLRASRILRDKLGADKPIVLLTADSLLPSSDLEDYGITTAYVKPISEQDIKLKILSLLE